MASLIAINLHGMASPNLYRRRLFHFERLVSGFEGSSIRRLVNSNPLAWLHLKLRHEAA